MIRIRRRSLKALFQLAQERRVKITHHQRAFLWEKLLGSNDKEAALAAGYSHSVAENTKQKIWSRAGVRQEFERLDRTLRERYSHVDDRGTTAPGE